jgi:hypothetical protein
MKIFLHPHLILTRVFLPLYEPTEMDFWRLQRGQDITAVSLFLTWILREFASDIIPSSLIGVIS